MNSTQEPPREPAEGPFDVPEPDEDDPLHGDPRTGSSSEDAAVEEVGLPPAGKDPMAGEAPTS
jgi:hypothetical protein